MAGWFRWEGGDLVLAVRVQPRARRDEVVGVHGDQLKIRITAPPLEGRANAHLQRFVAALFDVPDRQVVLLSGAHGRDKRLRVVAPRRLPEPISPPP